MLFVGKALTALTLAVGIATANAHYGDSPAKCAADGAICAGAHGMPLYEFIPCCNAGFACMLKDKMGYGEWIRTCVKESYSYSSKCFETNEHCRGDLYHGHIPYQKCCKDGDMCVPDTSKEGWGGVCKPVKPMTGDYTPPKDEYPSEDNSYSPPSEGNYYHGPPDDYYGKSSGGGYPDYNSGYSSDYQPSPHKYGDNNDYGNGYDAKYPYDPPAKDYGDGYGDYGNDYGKGSGGNDYGKGPGGNDFCKASPGDVLAVNAFPFVSGGSGPNAASFPATISQDSCGNTDLTASSLTLNAALAAASSACSAASSAAAAAGGSIEPGSCGISSISTGSIIITIVFTFTGTATPAIWQAIINAIIAALSATFGVVVTAGPAASAAP